MNGARHQLLARARLAQNEHGGGRGRDPHDQLRHFLHLGVLADDEVAFRLRLELSQHERISVLQLLRPFPLREEVPHEPRACPAHHLSGRWLELENGPLDFSAPRDVDDEVEPWGVKVLLLELKEVQVATPAQAPADTGAQGSTWKTPFTRRGKASASNQAIELFELLRLYPKYRYQSLVLQRVNTLYVSLRGQLSDQLREVDFCRARLGELVTTFEDPREAARRADGPTAGRCPLPEGCKSLDEAVRARAASRLLVTTVAPASASARAIAEPRYPVAPVIRATLSVRSNSSCTVGS